MKTISVSDRNWKKISKLRVDYKLKKQDDVLTKIFSMVAGLKLQQELEEYLKK